MAMLHSFKLIAFLPTTDYGHARRFYEGLLGLEYVSEDQFALVLKSGGNMIRVGKFESFTPAKNTIMGWEVSEIERVVAALQSKGVAFEKYPWVEDPLGLGIWTAPGGDKVAWFKDPDGNVLSVSEHK
jgi:catechol 2,3-dioxygenase-like lactoylglutathione lyase family enzyme